MLMMIGIDVYTSKKKEWGVCEDRDEINRRVGVKETGGEEEGGGGGGVKDEDERRIIRKQKKKKKRRE